MQVMFDAVTSLNGADNRIFITASRMVEGDLLYEMGLQAHDAPQLQRRIFYAAIDLGQDLKNTLKHLHAYRDDQLPFSFRMLINDTDLVLQPTDSAAIATVT